MRNLKTSDIFEFARCLRKIGIKEELKKVGIQANNIRDITSLGFDVLYDLFELATEKQGETALYEFLSKPFEMTVEEIENMDIDKLFEGVAQLANADTWKCFFKHAVQ